MRKVVLLIAFAALPLRAAIPLPPAPAHYVTDAANALDDEREHALNERLAQVDRETTNQLLVYVDRKVPEGTTLEEMGAEAIHTWAPGTKKTANGAILFLFLDDRKSRIEVGYGLEGELTDAKTKDILVSMRPALRDGDVTTAVERGVSQILTVIGAPAVQPVAPAPPRHYHEEESDHWQMLPAVLLLAGLIAVIIAIARKGRSALSRASTGLQDSPIRSTPMWDSSNDSSSSFSSSSPSDSSFDSSSDSGSDSSSFSGGGGDGGGGGSSDSW